MSGSFGKFVVLVQAISQPGRVARLRHFVAHLLMGDYVQVIEQLDRQQQEGLADLGRVLDTLAQVNARTAQMAELWVGSQAIVDELDDLSARYGTILRDLGRVSRRTEEATRLFIGQIDAPFEAFVIARRPLAQ